VRYNIFTLGRVENSPTGSYSSHSRGHEVCGYDFPYNYIAVKPGPLLGAPVDRGFELTRRGGGTYAALLGHQSVERGKTLNAVFLGA